MEVQSKSMGTPEPPLGWSRDPEHSNRLTSDNGAEITIFGDMIRVDSSGAVPLAAIAWLARELGPEGDGLAPIRECLAEMREGADLLRRDYETSKGMFTLGSAAGTKVAAESLASAIERAEGAALVNRITGITGITGIPGGGS